MTSPSLSFPHPKMRIILSTSVLFHQVGIKMWSEVPVAQAHRKRLVALIFNRHGGQLCWAGGAQGTNGVAKPGECCLWLGSGEVSRQHLLGVCFSWPVLQYPCTHCGLREFLIFSSCLPGVKQNPRRSWRPPFSLAGRRGTNSEPSRQI